MPNTTSDIHRVTQQKLLQYTVLLTIQEFKLPSFRSLHILTNKSYSVSLDCNELLYLSQKLFCQTLKTIHRLALYDYKLVEKSTYLL